MAHRQQHSSTKRTSEREMDGVEEPGQCKRLGCKVEPLDRCTRRIKNLTETDGGHRRGDRPGGRWTNTPAPEPESLGSRTIRLGSRGEERAPACADDSEAHGHCNAAVGFRRRRCCYIHAGVRGVSACGLRTGSWRRMIDMCVRGRPNQAATRRNAFRTRPHRRQSVH
ncbi:hypothetical protein BV20DRAFT_295392 [Pilatotrama ljubarskyi]|nr:hypothetical protein BV20DRAFT_295392 [Pilatotrama ljubarskyi]